MNAPRFRLCYRTLSRTALAAGRTAESSAIPTALRVAAALLLAITATVSVDATASAAEPPAAEAQEPPESQPEAQAESQREAPSDKKEDAAGPAQEREERFANYMTGAKLVGRFTVVGKPNDEMPEEEYTISKCEKLPAGDLYRFTARIRYGETDVELPMDLPVLWAGETPVITLSNLWIPGLGTFSARVLIHGDRYSGTWSHDEVGGHLFGVVKRAEEVTGAEE